MNQPLVAEEGRSWRIISTQCVGYGKPLFLGGADEIWTSMCTGILSDSFVRKSRGLSDAQIDSPARRFLNHWTTTDKNPRRDRVWDNWIDGEIDKFGLPIAQ